MVEKNCPMCRKITEHKTHETILEEYKDYVVATCQKCGFSELMPKNILQKKESELSKGKENHDIDNSYGFNREVGTDCDSGACPVR